MRWRERKGFVKELPDLSGKKVYGAKLSEQVIDFRGSARDGLIRVWLGVIAAGGALRDPHSA